MLLELIIVLCNLLVDESELFMGEGILGVVPVMMQATEDFERLLFSPLGDQPPRTLGDLTISDVC